MTSSHWLQWTQPPGGALVLANMDFMALAPLLVCSFWGQEGTWRIPVAPNGQQGWDSDTERLYQDGSRTAEDSQGPTALLVGTGQGDTSSYLCSICS